MSIFLGFNTAVRALMAQQLGINTTAHNIANANTPGFSHQDVIMVQTDPFTVPAMNRSGLAGQIGTGVNVTEIRRIRDEFLDKQFRLQNQGQAYWQTFDLNMKSIEDIFNEPSDNGLAQTLAQFWNRWRDLTNDPQDLGVRMSLREQSADLTSFIRTAYGQLVQKQRHLDEQIVTNVREINGIASQIESLNSQITKVVAIGDQPNDLRDRRDLLLDQLSKITRMTAFEMPDGSVAVSIGGTQIVGQDYFNPIKTQLNAQGFNDLQWSADGSPVTILGGEIKAQLDLRGTIVGGVMQGTIPSAIQSLNDLASTLVTEVNGVHAAGFGLNGLQGNFFTATAGREAETIDLVANIKSDVAYIAAAATDPTGSGGPGDGENARLIAGIQFALNLPVGASPFTATIDDFYRAFISALGSTSQEAERQAANQAILVQHTDQARLSVSGTSLDQEATNMIKYQRAYEAAARMVTTFDDMLDTIINRMGRVGR